jgi:hypothetical protein
MNVAESIIKPLRPNKEAGWHYVDEWANELGYPAQRWLHVAHRLLVISAVEVAIDKDGIDRGPEYHLSISKRTRSNPSQPMRCTSDEARFVLREFGLEGAEEDNHVPHGVVRNFWRTVAEPMIGRECACKATEPAIVEDKGDFIWRPA